MEAPPIRHSFVRGGVYGKKRIESAVFADMRSFDSFREVT